MKNYYEILDITVNASKAEIKKAYFKLVRKYPPDRFKDEFMNIREAYEILSDEKTREQYDSIHTMDPFIKSNYEYAKKLIEEDELNKAIKVLEELVWRAPEVSVLKLVLGETCRRNNNNGKAIKIFKELVEEQPSNAGFAGHLAYSYLDRGWQNKAVDAFLEALKLDADNVSFYLGLSEAYMRNDDIYASKNILMQAVVRLKDESEDNTAIYYQLIVRDIILDQLLDMEEHLEALTTMALKNQDIKDNIAWTLASLAKQLISLGRIDEARSVIKRASRLDTEDENILKILTEINNIDSIRQKFELLLKDKVIDENMKNLIGIHMDHNPKGSMEMYQNQGVEYSIKIGLLEELEYYKEEMKVLKRKYPELYNLEKDYFDAALSGINRKKMIRKLEKQQQQYAGLMSMMGNEFEFDEDDEDDYDDDFFGPAEEPYVREEAKVGRNDPCPCGSGKKYKKCCGK